MLPSTYFATSSIQNMETKNSGIEQRSCAFECVHMVINNMKVRSLLLSSLQLTLNIPLLDNLKQGTIRG
ncbi:hypothetical protein GmHk_13G036492 [Glycine max]|nr:hypothetical protein GmHk_13G036492 [Glycine max]